ncbi:alpha/beta hydrolase [Planktotalea sp.]|uniref:alpha/beta hydrolase n=1 Tax=Planktotalea sp. TaxID=2029877 RepID=UPI003D6B0FB9
MNRLMKWVFRSLAVLTLIIAVVAFVGPREHVNLNVSFDETTIGDDVDAYFTRAEAPFEDIVKGAEKRIIWAAEKGARAAVSVVYIHGFSATSEEIRPVPDNLAQALGANLVFTRLAGHGRSSEAMAGPTAGDWMRDTLEAIAIGRAIGDKVLLVSTSTGGTLVAAAAFRDDAMRDVAGVIFVSPNFAINSPASAVLTWPAVRWWGPIVAGGERSFASVNDDHNKYWTSTYPTVALMPMAALVKAVDALDFTQIKVPALFMISDQDKVVSPEKNRAVAEEWGGAAELMVLELNDDDDPYRHVIAGDILSPGQTRIASQAMIDWANGVLGSE